MEKNSDIPIIEWPFKQNTGEYLIVLPTRFNDDETNVKIGFPATTSRKDALAEIANSFQRNSADTQVQKMTDPDWVYKINAADYLQYKKDEDKYTKQKTELYGILKETGADLLGSAFTIASESGKAAWNALRIGDQSMAARHAWNVVEAGVQGTERLSMLGGLLGMKIGDLLTENPFKDTESSVESDLRRVQYAQEMGKVHAARKEGYLATENNGETPRYMISKPEGVPAATKADVDAANSMSNFLGVAWLIPVLWFSVNWKKRAGALMSVFCSSWKSRNGVRRIMETRKINPKVWAAIAAALLLIWAIQNQIVSKTEFESRDAYLCSAINNVGQRARDAEEKADRLASKVRELSDEVDRLKRALR